MGVETPIGSDLDDMWSHLVEGKSGIAPISSFDASGMPCQIAGEVQLDDHFDATTTRRTSRFQRLLLSATRRALNGCDLDVDLSRVAIVVGTGGGGMSYLTNEVHTRLDRMARDGWAALDRFTLLRTLPNMAAALVAQDLGATGPCLTLSTACAASSDAVGLARSLLLSGQADIAVVGGVEAWIDRAAITGFVKLQAVSGRPAHEAAIASRPFDRDRDGMVPAEGAAVLVLERHEQAIARGRTVYGLVLGTASTCDADHPVMPRADGIAAAGAITAALKQAGLPPQAVDVVSAHGTSTRLNDVAETRALKLALGDSAHSTPITAPKSVLGHTLGASGAIELVALVLSIRHQTVPPTANLDNVDPDCDLDYTPLRARPANLGVGLKCSFGFGGQNSAIVVGHPDFDSVAG